MKKLLPIVVCLAALALAFTVGRLTAPVVEPATPETRKAPVASVPKDSAPRTPASPSSADEEEKALAKDPKRATEIGQREEALLSAAGEGQPLARMQALLDQVQAVSLKDIPLLMARLGKSPDLRASDEAQSYLMARWAEAAPEAALAWVKQHPTRQASFYDSRMGALFDVWAEKDPQGAIQAAKSLPELNGRRYLAMQVVMHSLSMNDPQGAVQILQANELDSYYGEVFSALAVSQPQQAYQQALALDNKNQQMQALYGLFSTWGRTDPDRALTAALSASDNEIRRESVQRVLSQLAQRNPQAAVDLYNDLDDTSRTQWGATELYSVWAESDPQAAISHAQSSLENFQTRQDALSNVLRVWYNGDAAGAVDFLAQMPDSAVRTEMLHQFSSQAAGKGDMDRAFELVEMIPLGQSRKWAMNSLAGALADTDPQQAIVFIEANMSGVARQDAYSNLMYTLAGQDREAALNILARVPAGNQREGMIRTIMDGWVKENPDEALAWVETLDKPYEREQAMQEYYWTLASEDPVGTAQLALDLPDSLRSDTLSNALSNWIRASPEAALTWANGLPDASLRTEALTEALNTWGGQNPAQAAAWIDQHAPEQRAEFANSLLFAWASSDPESAAAWIEQIPADEGYDEAQSTLVSRWVQQDLPSAAAYMAKMPAGDARDQAIQSLVYSASRYEPAYAAEWSLRVKNENQRNQLLRESVQSWGSQDKAAARQFVISQDFPQSQRDKLMEVIDEQ